MLEKFPKLGLLTLGGLKSANQLMQPNVPYLQGYWLGSTLRYLQSWYLEKDKIKFLHSILCKYLMKITWRNFPRGQEVYKDFFKTRKTMNDERRCWVRNPWLPGQRFSLILPRVCPWGFTNGLLFLTLVLSLSTDHLPCRLSLTAPWVFVIIEA